MLTVLIWVIKRMNSIGAKTVNWNSNIGKSKNNFHCENIFLSITNTVEVDLCKYHF